MHVMAVDPFLPTHRLLLLLLALAARELPTSILRWVLGGLHIVQGVRETVGCSTICHFCWCPEIDYQYQRQAHEERLIASY